MLRVAVEPQLGIFYRKRSGNSLLHKAAGHQRCFIKKDTTQRDALNQHIGGFILTAKDIEMIFTPIALYRQQIDGTGIGQLEICRNICNAL